jgi:hypothetical protein
MFSSWKKPTIAFSTRQCCTNQQNQENERTKLMKLWAQYLLTAITAMGTSFAVIAIASADTCTLELKKLESRNSSSFSPTDSIYRATRPQSFNAQIGPAGKNQIRFGGAEEVAASFKKIVKTEPKYESDHPYRGVVKFGSQEYAFALDEAIPDSEKKKAESDEKDAKSQTDDAKKESKETKSDSAVANLVNSLLQALSPSDRTDAGKPLKAMSFNRLYFDLNHNGDLTDDKVIEAESMPGQMANQMANQSFKQFSFPRADVTIDVDGTKVDYAFLLSGYVNSQRDFSYAGIQVYSAAYREGEITLDGKKRRVVLLDNNSNGRFDDTFQVSKESSGRDGQVYLQQGDMLLTDSNSNQQNSGAYTPPNQAMLRSRHYVCKIVDIDGRCYDLKISPAGDELTLTPSTVRLGKITNPNAQFSAVIYSDQGVLEINGKKDTPISVPEGEWKLLSYNINQIEPRVPSIPAEKKDDPKKSSGESGLGRALDNLLGNSTPMIRSGPQFTIISAQGTAKYKPVKVSEGETVELPFGPPYKPLVTLDTIQGGGSYKQAQLGMSLVGSVGEMVTNMMVNGTRPAKPEFTIKDPKGEVVQTGSFEYG